MSAAWPAVAGWLVTTLPTLAGWSNVVVFDGQPVTGDSPTDYATPGYSRHGDTAGDFDQVTSEDGLFISETGHVYFDLVCQSGDDGNGQLEPLADVRTRCFNLLDALRANVKADATLGGLLSKNADITLNVQPLPAKNQRGTALSLVVTFGYSTLVWDL